MGMPGQVETILKLHRNSPRPRPTGPATITLAVATFKLAPAATAVDITGKVYDKKTNDPLSATVAFNDAVVAYLTQNLGIDPSRLTSRGYGEGMPIATNDTDAGRALNRRVEFKILGEK